MLLPKDHIDHIALLARLSLSPEEREAFRLQLGSILEYMQKLNQLDTSSVQPTSHVLSLQNVMRDDVVGTSLPREEALANAPVHTEKFYRVPRIIE